MNLLYFICLFIGFGGLFVYFYLKNIDLENEIDELYDMFYEEKGQPKEDIKPKGKVTVLKEVK